MRTLAIVLLLLSSEISAFSPPQPRRSSFFALFATNDKGSHEKRSTLARRGAVERLLILVAAPLIPSAVHAEEESIFAPKFVQQYEDFKQTKEGWSYRDVSEGKGEAARLGDRVVVTLLDISEDRSKPRAVLKAEPLTRILTTLVP